MPVYKTTIVLTVFAEMDTLEYCQHVMFHADMDHILHEMQEGAFIGQSHVGETVLVPPDKIEEEMIAIGNDGSFFLSLDDDDEDDE